MLERTFRTTIDVEVEHREPTRHQPLVEHRIGVVPGGGGVIPRLAQQTARSKAKKRKKQFLYEYDEPTVPTVTPNYYGVI
jgi:TctA family transporter